MKVESIIKIPDQEKQLMIHYYRNMRDSNRILVIDGKIRTDKAEINIDKVINMYSKEHLYVAYSHVRHSNELIEIKSREFLIERYVEPDGNDMVIVERKGGYFTEWFDDLSEPELKSVFGVVLEESLNLREN